MATNFPMRARREDPEGHMVVQQMVEYLRDVFDKFTSGVIRGSGVVPNGATSMVVTLPYTIGNYSVCITPTSAPGGIWWITGRSAAQFTINLAVAAPVSGVAFDWIIKSA